MLLPLGSSLGLLMMHYRSIKRIPAGNHNQPGNATRFRISFPFVVIAWKTWLADLKNFWFGSNSVWLAEH
jgi:hypothetical protein